MLVGHVSAPRTVISGLHLDTSGLTQLVPHIFRHLNES